MYAQPDVLVSHIKAALLHASTDDTRAPLFGVLFEPHFDFLRLVATDGHRLWLSELPVEDGAGDPFLLSRVDVLRLVKVIDAKKPKYGQPARVSLSRAADAIVAEQRDASLGAFAIVKADFPPYRQVLPADIPVAAERADAPLAPEYIADACKAFGLVADARLSGIVTLTGRASEDPVVMTCEGAGAPAFAVVMPVRVDVRDEGRALPSSRALLARARCDGGDAPPAADRMTRKTTEPNGNATLRRRRGRGR